MVEDRNKINETQDSLGDEELKERERKRHLRFAGIVSAVVILAGFLLFFDNMLNYFTSTKSKAPGQIDREGARISRISDEDRQVILARVRKAIEAGKIDEARVDVLNLLQKDNSPEAHFLAGTVYLRQGNIKGAYDHLKDAVKLKENYIEAQQKLGEIYVMVGDYKAAEEAASLLARNPDYLSEGHLLESEVALGQGNLDLALQKAQLALDKSKGPISIKQRVYMADIHLRKGDRAKAGEWIRGIDKNRLDAEGLLYLARYYLAAADEGKAVVYFREALQRYPDSPEVHYSYGQYLMSKRRFREAADYYQRALQSLPNVQVIAYQLGQAFLASGEREKAKALLESMIAKDPANILAWRLKTEYHLALGERQAAIETLNRITQYIPDAAASHALLAELHLQEGVVSLAEKNAQKAIALGDKTVTPQMVLADVAFKRRQYDKAVGYYAKVLQLQSNNLAALLQSGDSYMNQGQLEKAEAFYRRASTQYPNVGFVQTKLARVRANQGDRAGSLGLAKQYYQQKPDDPKAIAEYANALILNDKWDEALNVVSSNVKKLPQNWYLHFVLGDLYLLKRDTRSAHEQFSRAATLNPDDLNLAMNLATRYDQAGMAREAEEQYLRAYKKAPHLMPIVNEVAWYYIETRNSPQQAKGMIELLKSKGDGANEKDTVGWYYFNMGDIKQAEYYLREAMTLDPANPIIRGHWVLLLAHTKREQEAKTEGQRIINSLPDGKLKDRVGAIVTHRGR